MKKYFLVFGIMGGLFTNTANAVGSQAVVTYTCPEGCQLSIDSSTYVSGQGGGGSAYGAPTCTNIQNGSDCGNPSVTIVTENAIAPHNDLQISPVTKPNKASAKKKAVSARAAEMPKMVKKIVYEQVVEEDEE